MIVLISVITFLASFVGTITGFGLSTIMLPIMVLFMPFSTALLFVGIIHLFSDLWKVLLFRKGFDRKIVLYFAIPGVITSFLGAVAVLSLPEQHLIKILGILIIIYSLFMSIRPDFRLIQNVSSYIIGGTASGFLAGIFGTGGAVRAIFLSAYNLPKSVFLFSTGAIGVLIDTARLITYWQNGIELPKHLAISLLIFIPISFISTELSKKTIGKITKEQFRQLILIFLFVIGIVLAG